MAKKTKNAAKTIAKAGIRGFTMGGATRKRSGGKNPSGFVNLLPTVNVKPKKKTFWQKFKSFGRQKIQINKKQGNTLNQVINQK